MAELLGLAEIATLLGATKQVISNWRNRNKKGGFPAPAAELKSGPVWYRDDIIRWAKREGVALAQTTKREPSVKRDPERRACIAALMNMKGGVGKSTLATNLGWYAAYARNYRVLFVDLDPQFNLSQYVLGAAAYEQIVTSKKPTIEALFRNEGRPEHVKDVIQEVVNYRDGSRVHLIPASLELAWTMKTAVERSHLLRDYLEEVRTEYDLILIDCPPTESTLSTAAYHAADYVFVPVRPEFLSTIGLPLLLKSMNEFAKTYKHASAPELGGIIFNDTMDKLEHDKSRVAIKDVAREAGWPIFKSELSHSESYPAGARLGKPIFMTEKARWTKKDELARVGNEFLERMGL